MADSPTILGEMARSLGTSEPALRLLTSLLLGYPLGLIHRHTLHGAKPAYQHVFFALTGLAIGYFNYGWEVLHSCLTVASVYAILRLAGGSLLSVLLTFGFTMTYLLVGYYVTSTHVADIRWTMAQCVLTLRLMGLTYDVYDGKRPAEKRSAALLSTPTLLEVAAHTYFPASFLVGPQFSMKKYLEFSSGKFAQAGHLPDSVWPGLKRGLFGLFYLAVYQVGILYFPTEHMLSVEFGTQPFYKSCIFLGLWGKIVLYKYVACWLLAEGVCILTGLAYNGTDEHKRAKWDGCANVNLEVYENTTKFQHIIESFNMNTNNWAAHYIYKRMKFLGSRLASQIVTLIFLAVWHGVHTGYYMCFFLEFFVLYMEKDCERILSKNQSVSKFLIIPAVRPFIWLLQKSITLVVMGYALASFVLLSYERWIFVYKSVYLFGHIIFMSWPICVAVVRFVFHPKVSTPVTNDVSRSTNLDTNESSAKQKKY